jgi:hypothetical protein
VNFAIQTGGITFAESSSCVVPNNKDYDTITLEANSSYNAVLSFVQEYTPTSVVFCSDTGRVDVTKNTTKTLNIPSDCNYIIITLVENNIYNRTPNSITLVQNIRPAELTRIDNIEKLLENPTSIIKDVDVRFISVCNRICKYVLTLCDDNYAGEVVVTKTNDFRGSSMTMPLNVANAAVCLSKLLASGLIDNTIVSHTNEQIGNYVHKLVVAAANAHIGNVVDGWGNDWQTPLVAGNLANCVIFCKDLFSVEEKQLVNNMVLSECDYVMGITSASDLYWKDRQGTVLNPGDSKIEECLWNAMPLGAALVLCQGDTDYNNIWYIYYLH